MKKVKAPLVYDPANEQSFRNEAQAADDQNVKKNTEWNPVRLVLTSPNGTRYQLTVSNAGAAVFTAV